MTITKYQSIEYCPCCSENRSVAKRKIEHTFKNGISTKIFLSICKTCNLEFQSADDKRMSVCDIKDLNNKEMLNMAHECKSAANYSVSSSSLSNAQDAIDIARDHNDSVGSLSDGYHTFDELYHHRALLFASLCMTSFKSCAWKSLLHDDPENNPMYPGMFIVGIETPEGQATYHYNIDPYWSMFKVRELDHAPKYDGHTPNDAIERIYKFACNKNTNIRNSAELFVNS